MRLVLLLLLVVTVQCWWPWDGDEEEEVREEEEEREKEEEGFKEQLERDLAGLGQEVVLKSDHTADSKQQEESVEGKKEERELIKEVERELSESDEANIAALLDTPELARKLDRKAFEEKLEEVPLPPKKKQHQRCM